MNLNIFGKDNIVCISLVNSTMCLNSIGELKEQYLNFTLKELRLKDQKLTFNISFWITMNKKGKIVKGQKIKIKVVFYFYFFLGHSLEVEIKILTSLV